MKITSVEIIQQTEIKLPRDYAWILIHTDEDITGLGELNRRPNEIISIIRDWTPNLLIGQDPRHIERIWEALFYCATPYGNTGAARRAISAIDMALWDIASKALNAPVWQLLGGMCRDRVPVYSTGGIGGSTREEVHKNVKRMIELGWKAAKTGPFGSRESHDPSKHFLWRYASLKEVARGVEVMGWIKEAAKDDFDVGIDHHPLWDVHGATRVIRAMELFNLMFFECPIIEDNVDAWAALARDCRVPLMCGEYSQSRYQILPFIERNIVSIVNPDLAWVGGITEIKRIGILAKTHGVAVAPHDSGPVTTYARCHVMANMSNAFYMELSSATQGMWDAVTEELTMEDSSLPVPMKPGLGVELNPEIISASRWQAKNSQG
jgi:galactonate dehydratase